jgi:exodeoxyribonuclease-5
VFRVDGYAGTGKTTIIRHAIAAPGIENVCYAAYTGKAASVMNRKGIPATTIHRLLYHPVEDEEEDPKTKKKVKVVRWRMKMASEAAGADLIVLDEVSMVNGKLARDLTSFGRPILVLGDPGQLPPINGDGAFMTGAPDVLLTQIHRQALESKIRRSRDDGTARREHPVREVRSGREDAAC